ncbi:MAG TPA: insulinase family protein [Thermoanaerobaculia bacterium]|nr:insulinase family protein [Thermoanaerobaculia bacterium]
MRSLRNHAAALAAGLVLVAGSAAAQVKDYREIKTPALRSFTMPQPKRIQLDNGMVIFLQEDHELPLIRGTARIRGGGRDVPAEKAGLAGIYGQAWRTGGTDSKTGDQLDELLESRAARVETFGGDDSASVTFDTLKGDFDTVFPIFVDVLQHPAFRQEKIDLAKTQANTNISRRNDEPLGIAGRETARLGYGTDSPYARQPEYATIASITRDDLLAFHKKYTHPNNIILGLVGDFDSAAMEQKLRSTFGAWPKGPAAPKAAPAGGTPAAPGVYFIPKDDVTQAYINLVHAGTTRNNPDYYPLLVMNEILGGGFSGRLMNEIRSKLGLAYSVGGGVGAEWDHPALFRVSMGTKSGSVAQAIDALKGQLAALHNQPFTNEELALAKESILNAFIFNSDSKAKVLNQRMGLEFYGYPADWWQQYAKNVEKVTAADVARVAKQYVHPDQVALLVVGKEKDFDKPMSSLGTVKTIDITIPEPGAKPSAAGPSAAAPAKTSADGTALVHKLRDFVGGKAKIDAVNAVHTVMTMTAQGPQGPMEVEVDSTVRYPDASRRVIKTPMGEMTQVYTADTAFMSTPQGLQDIPSSQSSMVRNEMKAELVAILKNADNPAYTFNVTGTEKVGDVTAQVLEVNTGATTSKWYIDPATGRLLRKVSQGRMGEQTTDYSEWKQFGGLNLPTAYTLTTNGEKTGGGTVKTIDVNPTVDPSIFTRPAS